MIFIDLKKKIDTIDHVILIQKLQMYGVDQNGIKFFESYLKNRSQRCCVDGKLSGAVKLTCGVPQGSSLRIYYFLNILMIYPIILKRLLQECSLTTLISRSQHQIYSRAPPDN